MLKNLSRNEEQVNARSTANCVILTQIEPHFAPLCQIYPKTEQKYLSRRHGEHGGTGFKHENLAFFPHFPLKISIFPRDLRVLRASVRFFLEKIATWHGFCYYISK